MRRSMIVLAASALVIAAPACAESTPEEAATSQPAPGEAIESTEISAEREEAKLQATESPTDRPVLTDTPAPTVTSTPTRMPSPSPVPEGLRRRALETWEPLALIQMNAEILSETALRIDTGELTGFAASLLPVVLVDVINAVDQETLGVQPVPELEGHWEEMLVVQDRTKDILAGWRDKEIDTVQVIAEAQPLVAEAERILTETERILSEKYGFPEEELTLGRQQRMKELRDSIAGAPTPAP